mmetsp:Transcript_26239/g.40042  ORF Transcript_26239/g.40042 Transcript_26239/m.40042 type:complete len:98 (-) Transcript_26239:2408-2701(-)
MLETVSNLGESIKIAIGKDSSVKEQVKAEKQTHSLLKKKLFRVYQGVDKPTQSDHFLRDTPLRPSSHSSSLLLSQEEDLSISDLLDMDSDFLREAKL